MTDNSHASSFSRCAFASESCHATARKPVQLSSSKRREAERRQTHRGVRIAAASPRCWRKLSAVRRAPLRARSPFGAPPRHIAGVATDSAPGRASWNHRMQSGGPSPAPVQRAPRSPITRRTGRCPKPPARAVYRRARGNRPRSAFRSTLAKASFVERDLGEVIGMATCVKGGSLNGRQYFVCGGGNYSSEKLRK
jgi:hypothetical protein